MDMRLNVEFLKAKKKKDFGMIVLKKEKSMFCFYIFGNNSYAYQFFLRSKTKVETNPAKANNPRLFEHVYNTFDYLKGIIWNSNES